MGSLDALVSPYGVVSAVHDAGRRYRGQHGLFAMVKDSNRLVQGTTGAAIHDAVAPKDGDLVVTKKRVSAFAASDLECVLRASGRTHLVLLGVATSGVVLSTLRELGCVVGPGRWRCAFARRCRRSVGLPSPY